MVGEQRVAIHEVKFAFVRVREASCETLDVFGCIQAQQIIKKLLDGIPVTISYWLI